MKRTHIAVLFAIAIAVCLTTMPAWAAQTLATGSIATSPLQASPSTANVQETPEQTGVLDASALLGTQAQKPSVSYCTHVQYDGWQSYVKNGAMSGTEGRSLRLEGIRIKLSGVSGGIQYRTHVQNLGWETGWKKNGAMSGTEGMSYRLEAIQIQLTGQAAAKYDIYYRVHCQNIGWMDWARNGASAGSAGFSYRLEGIQIKLVPKGGAAPGSTSGAFRTSEGFLSGVPDNEVLVKYRTHVQNAGWQNYVHDGEMSGTQGRSLRLEGINVKLGGAAGSGGITYRTHVQNIGWESDWKTNGVMSGTYGRSLRLEAIQIKLTGDAGKKFDVYYRVHCQNIGWMGWAKNGEYAGSSGFGYRLEGIEIKLVKKGGAAPGKTDNAYQRIGSEIGDKIVDIALAEYQSGVEAGDYHKGGEKYWSVFVDEYEPWCSEFTGWCMKQAGLVPKKTMTKNPNWAGAFLKFYEDHPNLGTIHENDGSYKPQKGDICIHVDSTGWPVHTEICVESYRNGSYVDVSGNSGDRVKKLKRKFPNDDVGYYIELHD